MADSDAWESNGLKSVQKHLCYDGIYEPSPFIINQIKIIIKTAKW